MLSGKFVKIDLEKGFGFIKPDGTSSRKDNVYTQLNRQSSLSQKGLALPKVGDRVNFVVASGRTAAEWWQFIEPAKRYAPLPADEIALAKEILGIHLAAFDLGRSEVLSNGAPLTVYWGHFPGSPVKNGTLGQVLLWAWLYAKEQKVAELPILSAHADLPHYFVAVHKNGAKVMDPDGMPFYLEAQAEARADALMKRNVPGVQVISLWQATPTRMRLVDLQNLLGSTECRPVFANDNSRVNWYDLRDQSRVLVATGRYIESKGSEAADLKITVAGEEYTGEEIRTLFSYGRWVPEKSLVH